MKLKKKMPMCAGCGKPTFHCACGGQAKVKRKAPKANELEHSEEEWDDDDDEDMREIERLEAELLGDDVDTFEDGSDNYPDMPPPARRTARGGRPPAPAAPVATGAGATLGTMDTSKVFNSNFLLALAMAHQQQEGGKPTDRNMRNNNPGNLQPSPLTRQVFGNVPLEKASPVGGSRFLHFPSYNDGLHALMLDLWAKLTGRSRSSGSIHTLLDYVRVYAPADDGNDPNGYAGRLVVALNSAGYPVSLQTPVATLASFI
jgi:hypothetical protein